MSNSNVLSFSRFALYESTKIRLGLVKTVTGSRTNQIDKKEVKRRFDEFVVSFQKVAE